MQKIKKNYKNSSLGHGRQTYKMKAPAMTPMRPSRPPVTVRLIAPLLPDALVAEVLPPCWNPVSSEDEEAAAVAEAEPLSEVSEASEEAEDSEESVDPEEVWEEPAEEVAEAEEDLVVDLLTWEASARDSVLDEEEDFLVDDEMETAEASARLAVLEESALWLLPEPRPVGTEPEADSRLSSEPLSMSKPTAS